MLFAGFHYQSLWKLGNEIYHVEILFLIYFLEIDQAYIESIFSFTSDCVLNDNRRF